MAIDYAEANLAWDAMCADEERWLNDHAERTCSECKHFEECPCGCEWGICHDCNELVYGKDKVKDYEHFCWRERL